MEAYVSTRGIAQTWRELAPGDERAAGPDDAATVAALARAAAEQDPTAAAVIDRTGRYLGAAVANLVNLLNPGPSSSAIRSSICWESDC